MRNLEKKLAYYSLDVETFEVFDFWNNNGYVPSVSLIRLLGMEYFLRDGFC
jgi:hypothetical protein